MKITFFSNYLTHQQIPFCLEMQKLLGEEFTFVSTVEEEKNRFAVGYSEQDYPFNLKSFETSEKNAEAQNLAIESDIIIFGSAPEKLFATRFKERKITFRYSERIFKSGRLALINPRIALSYFRFSLRNNKKNVYLLCAGAYVAKDYNMIGTYIDKCFKWGYFPQFIMQEFELLFKKKQNNQIKLLWAGRFLDWKHPEKAVAVADFLKGKGYEFHLDMIGSGVEFCNIADLIEKKDLKDKVSLLGSMPPDKVRENMDEANIFLLTSDSQEGWGVVLNEAMNSCCSVIASYEAGSVPYLLKEGENGLIYKGNSTQELCEKTELLLCNKNLQEKFGKNAYFTIANEWNAENAAHRFVELCENLLSAKNENLFSVGILSRDDRKL